MPESRAMVSVFDRSFLFGDGLFETILVRNCCPFRWEQHMVRLQSGADFLKIKLPFRPKQLRKFADGLLRQNRTADALLRVTLSRGVGTRGYSPKDATQPTLVMTTHPAPPVDVHKPEKWKLAISSIRLPAGDTLARFKTNNRLAQVCSRAEAEAANADEALLLDSDGHVIEGATSNLFWVKNGVVYTSPLTAAILPGITRALVLEVCRNLAIKSVEKQITLPQLKAADGVFLSLTSRIIVAAKSIGRQKLKQPPLIQSIYREGWRVIQAETA